MSQTTLSIRMDETLKKQFDAMCNDFGMNISTAVTIFAKTIVRERRIPFEIAAGEETPNAETLAAMREVEDIIAGKIQTKQYSSFKEFLADLDSEEDEDAVI